MAARSLGDKNSSKKADFEGQIQVSKVCILMLNFNFLYNLGLLF